MLLQLLPSQESQICVGPCDWKRGCEWKTLAASTAEMFGSNRTAAGALSQPRPVQGAEPLQYMGNLMLRSGTVPVPFLILQSSSGVKYK